MGIMAHSLLWVLQDLYHQQALGKIRVPGERAKERERVEFRV